MSPSPIPPDDAIDLEPARPPRRDGDGPVVGRAAGMGVDRLVLVTVAIVTSLALVSYRYHFYISHYGKFIYSQVLPASGLRVIKPMAIYEDPDSDLNADLAEYGTPYLPSPFGKSYRRFSAVGSDYLGVWHYTRELLRGHNPYSNHASIHYISRSQPDDITFVPLIRDAGVPEQTLGGLSYFPMGIILPLVFYLPNYFASLSLYYAAFHVFVFCLCYYLVRRSPGHRLPATILVASMFLTSFPIGFLLERGNTEGIIFMLLVLGLVAYAKAHYYPAAVLLGLAASAKLAPAVFFALFLLDRRFKALAVAMAVLVGSNLVAMLFMNEDLATLTRQILTNLGAMNKQIVSNTVITRFNHSLYNSIRGLIHPFVDRADLAEIMGRLLPSYTYATMVASGFCLVRLRNLAFVNRVLILTLILLLFPSISYDYKLIHLYIAFGLIAVDVLGKGFATRPQVVAILLFAVLFSPKSYHFKDYAIDYFINDLCMIALFFIGLTSRLGSPDSSVPVRHLGADGTEAAAA